MKDLNLLPRTIRERAAVRRRLALWSVVLGLSATTLTAGTIGVRLIGGKERSRLESDGGRLAERASRANAVYATVHQQVIEHSQRLEASETVGVHPNWAKLMRALAILRGDDIVLRAIDVTTIEQSLVPKPEPGQKGKSRAKPVRFEAYSLVIKGYGLSHTGVVQFSRRLEDLGLMRDVSLKETRAEPHLSVPAVWFELECRMSERTDGDLAIHTEIQN